MTLRLIANTQKCNAQYAVRFDHLFSSSVVNQEKGKESMAQSIEIMEQRYQMLLNRKGKNSENVGIMRKLRRKINKAKQGVILS